MREIKFRYWDEQLDMMFKPEDGRDTWEFTSRNGVASVDGFLMQFTGSKDKNKKEIYESDIIKVNGVFIGIVKYVNGSFIIEEQVQKQFFYLGEHISSLAYEVIGNLYENTTLIEL